MIKTEPLFYFFAMKIVKVPHIKGTPARTNRKTGVIYISEWHFKRMKNEVFKKFVIYHEMAHFLFKTKNEQMCDEFATQVLLRQGVRMKKILHAITDTLSGSQSHYGRKVNILNLLRIKDYLDNNNVKVLNKI